MWVLGREGTEDWRPLINEAVRFGRKVGFSLVAVFCLITTVLYLGLHQPGTNQGWQVCQLHVSPFTFTWGFQGVGFANLNTLDPPWKFFNPS